MSVLCCRIPDFLTRLHVRHHPHRGEHPLALLGGDERVWAVSPAARQCGVRPDMTPRQAQMNCPDLCLQPLDSEEAEAEQSTFLATLSRSDLPVEPVGWGAAYLDLHWLATERPNVEPLCAGVGQRLRQEMGEWLVPALGWDSGKFTARAAALRTPPGRMRLIERTDEVHFLRPLPVTLLPLPAQALQHLHWLGITTLGQYAQLPQVAVWQRFGQAGKLAWQWAQGRDRRPVQAIGERQPDPLTLDVEPPGGRVDPVLATVLDGLHPLLTELREQLTGIRRLRLSLHFLDASSRTVHLNFVDAVDGEERLRAVLKHELEALIWPAEVEQMTLWILETGELPIRQAALFPELAGQAEQPLAAICEKLRSRFGPVFYRGVVPHPRHPVAERRSRLQPLAG